MVSSALVLSGNVLSQGQPLETSVVNSRLDHRKLVVELFKQVVVVSSSNRCIITEKTKFQFYYSWFLCQVLSQLDSILSSQHLASSTAVETRSVGLTTSQQSVTAEPSDRGSEWRPKSFKVK